MINEILNMNGYGIYVLSAFGFTLFSFGSLYVVTKIQFVKEQSKFLKKFGSLNTSKAAQARTQRINQEILSGASNI